MNLGSVPTVPAGDTYLNSATNPGGRPGSQAWSRDGRRFRLFKNGAGGLSTGSLVQGPVTNVGHLVMVPTADIAVGSKTIRVTAGSGAGTNVPANTYAGGLAVVSSGVGAGCSFAVKSHEAIVATQPFTIVLESDEAIWTPLTAASSKIDLVASPYNGSVISPGAATAAGAIGVVVTNVDIGNWGFLQVEGLALAIADGAIGAGQAISPSVTTAGTVTINSTTLPIIGVALKAGIAAQAVEVSLNLP